MVVDIVVPERLLNHKQIELVEFAKMFKLIQSVGGIGIATQRDVRPPRTDALKNLHIPSRLDFDFDAAIPGGKFDLNLVQQLLDGILDADGHATWDLVPSTTEELPQRLLLLSSLRVPECVFES